MSNRNAAKRYALLSILVVLCLSTYLALTVCQWRKHQQMNADLITAIKRSDVSAVSLLLKKGADPNTRESPQQEESLWHILLTRFNADKTSEQMQSTALFVAMGNYERGSHFPANAEIRIIKSLLEAGADVNAGDDQGGTPLMESIIIDRPDISELLLNYGADKSRRSKDDGSTAYSLAASHPSFIYILPRLR